MYCISENSWKILFKDVICTTSTWAMHLLCFVCIRFFSWKRREKSQARITISVWRHRRDLTMHVSHWSICQLMHHYLGPVPESLTILKTVQHGTAADENAILKMEGKLLFAWRHCNVVALCDRMLSKLYVSNSKALHPVSWPWPTVNSRLNVRVKIRRDYEDESTIRGEPSVFSQQRKINVETGISIVMLAQIISCSRNTNF